MSLIDDAMRAAQREKSRLDATSARPFAPVLVRLRPQPRQRMNRIHLMAGAGALVVAIATLLWVRGLGEPALQNVPPLTSAILSEALASDSTRGERAAAQVAQQSSAPRRDPIAPETRRESAPAAASLAERRGRGASSTASARAETAAVLQGESATSDRPGSTTVRRVPSEGTLRIAVEDSRGGNAARLFREAVIAHRSGQLDRARSLYEQVLAITPDDGDALNNLGVLLSADGQFDRALELLRRAVAAAPRNAGAWNNIGAVLREQGLADGAISAFRSALTIDSRHQGARVGLAQQYLATQELARAHDLLREVLADNPALAEAHYTLGQVFERQGDTMGAIAAYTLFTRYAPARLSSHVDLVRRRIEALSRPIRKQP